MKPNEAAAEMLNKLEIPSAPVILNAEDILIVTELDGVDEMDVDFEGLLVIEDGVQAIIIKQDVLPAQRKRFTLAHELGHYELHRHKSKTYKCNPTESIISDMKKLAPDEIEANQFAAELLMPEQWFKTDVAKMTFGMNTIKDMSKMYDVSRTATAYRYINYCGYVAAIVISDGNSVLSFKGSPEFFDEGCFVSPKTKVKPVPDGKIHKYEYHEWLDANSKLDRYGFPIYEQSIEMSSYNRVISLVYFEDEFDDDDF